MKTDFALAVNREAWLRHPVFGDPSFDSFERLDCNPIHRGCPPLQWPVNCFLFVDPKDDGWYAYVGNYALNYSPEPPGTCTVYRSRDKGKTWVFLGNVFNGDAFKFDGYETVVAGMTDVSVVYDNGRYHMLYDWCNADCTWANVRSEKSGVGYAVSDRPEGPFIRHPVPVVRNDRLPDDPVTRKYNRYYATTLVKRKNDWMLLAIMDAGPWFSWGLVGMTADKPEGPYSHATPLFHVEGDHYQAPLMEYFPSFTHDGWVYAPATSVALNRNFQTVHRAPVEEAMKPGSWELFQHGSVWHGLALEHEAWGMWGQAYSGHVQPDGTLYALFPSKDNNNCGTINLAKRPWDSPFRNRGFTLSGHQGPSMTLLRGRYRDFRLHADFSFTGEVSFFYGYEAPLGPDRPKSVSTLHPLSGPGGRAFHLTGDYSGVKEHQLEISCDGIVLDGKRLSGRLDMGSGAIGLRVEKNSHVEVFRFEVEGEPLPGGLSLLPTEGLLGAGQNLADWEEVHSPLFRFNEGFVSKGTHGRAKWNYHGRGFELWSPRGPSFGTADVVFDGKIAATLDFGAASETTSAPLFRFDSAADGFHAVVLRAKAGKMPVDSINVIFGEGAIA